MENTQPVEKRAEALMQILEILGKRDIATQIRTLECVILFLGLPFKRA